MDTEVTTSTLSRRERKKQQTRRALREAALRLFAERGFHSTTVEEITNAADLAPRTFFLHFSCKEDVLLGSPEDIVELFRKRMEALPPDGDPLEGARQVIRGLVEDIGEDTLRLLRQSGPPAAHLASHAASHPDAAHKVRHFFQLERTIAETAARATGLDARTDVYPTLVAQVVMTTMRAALTVWLERDPATTRLGDLIDEAFATLASGLAPPAPRPAGQTRGSPE